MKFLRPLLNGLLSLMVALTVLTFSTLASAAGPFGLPDHTPDGYRDSGCDPAFQVAVPGTNYFNNPTCPKPTDSGPKDLEEEPSSED